MQRHLAQRFKQAARVREKSHAVLVQLRRQRRRVASMLPSSSSTASAENNSHQLSAKLRVLVEMATQLQIHLHQQQTHFEPRALRKVRRRLDDMTVRAAKIKNLAQRVRFLMRKMEKIVERASKIEERRQEPAADNDAESPEDDTGDEQEGRRPLSVELAAHQWVPPILWSIYESVERARRPSPSFRRRQDDDAMEKTNTLPVPREELHAAVQRLMEQMRDMNPYSHFHVVYRPPPPILPGDTIKWVVRKSSSVQQITDSLSHHFTQLHHTAFWLESPRSEETVADCERKFADLISLVRSLSTHFHYVVLYLYSIAMERADLNASVSSIARQAATHSLKIDLREAYGLSPSLLVTSDTLLRQTYAYFPEVLVFLDEWRREESFQAFGFATSEKISECVVDFHKSERKDQRTLVEIATCLKDVFHAWRRSKLGTTSFEMMQISEIGALEQVVKGRLGYIMKLLYQQNVAAWVQRRQRPDLHGFCVLNELRIMASATKRPVQVTNDGGGRQQERELSTTHSKPRLSSEDANAQLVAELQDNEGRRVVEIGAPTPASQVHVEKNEKAPASQDNVGQLESTPCAIRRQKQQHPENGGRFRAPGVLSLTEQCSATKAAKSRENGRLNREESAVKNSEPASGSKSHPTRKFKDEAKTAAPLELREARHLNIVQLKDIYAWTDEQVDVHEQEKEHIYELQQQLSVLRDRMTLDSVMQERLTTWVARNLPHKSKATLAMLEAWSRVRECALTTVCYSETIALHGAAEALIQRPSLRLNQEALGRDEKEAMGSRVTIVIDHSDDDAGDGDESLNTNATDKHETARLVNEEVELENLRELKETIGASRHSIAEMLKRYNGDQTSEWLNHFVFFAQASKNLLEIAHERLLPSYFFEVEEAREIQCVDSNAV